MLYHFNYGYPLLGPGAKVVGPILKTEPGDEEAKKGRGVEECTAFPKPIEGYKEKVFFHTLAAGADRKSFVALVNRNIRSWVPAGNPTPKGNEVPHGNGTPLGRGKIRELGKLTFLERQGRYEVTVEFEGLESVEEIVRAR